MKRVLVLFLSVSLHGITCDQEVHLSDFLDVHAWSLKQNVFFPDIQDLMHVLPKLTQSIGRDISPQEVLFVWDIDNTILRLSSLFGSTEWNTWQLSLLEALQDLKERQAPVHLIESLSSATVAPTAHHLHLLNSLIFKFHSFELMQPEIPSFIAQLQGQGVQSIGLTSRGPRDHQVTHQSLIQQGIHFETSTIGQTVNPFLKPVNPWHVHLPYLSEVELARRQASARDVQLVNGVFYTEGQDKGKLLELLLRSTNTWDQFKAIVFIDDSRSQVDTVRQTFSGLPIYTSVIHYTRANSDPSRDFNDITVQKQAIREGFIFIRYIRVTYSVLDQDDE